MGQAEPDQGRRRALRVLVVEDNPDGAEALRLVLESYGHAVEVAHDGPAALEAAGRFRPEVVLLDIGLPGMDGLEVARRLRATPADPRPVLVAVTGYGSEEIRRQTALAGFHQHLAKPVEPEILQEILDRLAAW
jgi:CheY-like chemotaxis protein